MCLLIASKNGVLPDEEAIENAWEANSDGFGVAWVQDGKLHICKTQREKVVKLLLDRAKGFPYIAHWRFGTHGTDDISNVHPFQINDNVAVAHNGIISNIALTCTEKSDTRHYVDDYLKPIAKYFELTQWVSVIEAQIGRGNKMALIDASTGEIAIAHEGEGHWDEGIWYSNYSHCNFNMHFGVRDRWGWEEDDYRGIRTMGRGFSLLRDADEENGNRVSFGDAKVLVCETCYDLVDKRDGLYELEGLAICKDCLDFYRKDSGRVDYRWEEEYQAYVE